MKGKFTRFIKAEDDDVRIINRSVTILINSNEILTSVA